jgi:hypothetical protein
VTVAACTSAPGGSPSDDDEILVHMENRTGAWSVTAGAAVDSRPGDILTICTEGGTLRYTYLFADQPVRVAGRERAVDPAGDADSGPQPGDLLLGEPVAGDCLRLVDRYGDRRSTGSPVARSMRLATAATLVSNGAARTAGLHPRSRAAASTTLSRGSRSSSRVSRASSNSAGTTWRLVLRGRAMDLSVVVTKMITVLALAGEWGTGPLD